MILEFEPLTACPVCGGTRWHKSIEASQYDYPLSFYRCVGCNVQFLNPRMTDAATEIYYRQVYRDLLKRIRWDEANDLRLQQMRAKAQVEAIREWLPVGSHLEIGCSAGYLLEAVNAPVSWGVEPDLAFRQMEPARRFRVVEKLEHVAYADFDLISLSHVLEHFNHPLADMRRILQTFAQPNTRLLVEVPNAAGTKEAFLIHHPIAFDPVSLSFLFARLGYRALDRWDVGGGKYILFLFERMGHNQD